MPAITRYAPPRISAKFARFATIALLATLPACTLSGDAGKRLSDAGKQNAALVTGGGVFGFDYQEVTELLIAKADPESGDRWSARLARPNAKADASEWTVQGAGGSVSPRDSRADGYFVMHLLDTLRTLRVEQAEVQGPLSSLGLEPPRFALQWRSGDQSFEFRVGAATPKGGTRYAWIPGQAPFVVSGASLQMLEYITEFSYLRLKTWAGLTADDVDEVEHLTQPAFYAQREGAEWTNRKHKPVRGDFDAWLKRLVHERVREFVDDEERAKNLGTWLDRSALRRVRLTDRHGRATQLELGRREGKWYARSSARPGGIFEVYPESSEALAPPR